MFIGPQMIAQKCSTIPAESGPGGNSIERVRHTFQNFSTGVSSVQCHTQDPTFSRDYMCILSPTDVTCTVNTFTI